LHGCRRALAKIVERLHPDCRKPLAPLSSFHPCHGTLKPGSALQRRRASIDRATLHPPEYLDRLLGLLIGTHSHRDCRKPLRRFTKEGEVALRVRKVVMPMPVSATASSTQSHPSATGETVSGFHPGRFPDRAPLWRHWARPGYLAEARAHDGRRRDRDERAG